MSLSHIFDSRGFNLVILLILIVLLIVVIVNVIYYYRLRSGDGKKVGTTMSLIMMIANIILGIVLFCLIAYFLWRSIFHASEREVYVAKISAKAEAAGTAVISAKNTVSRLLDYDTVKIQRDGKVVSIFRQDDGAYNTLKDGSGIAYSCDASKCDETAN